MIIYRSLSSVEYNKKSVISIGMFDGIHRAHNAIVNRVVTNAQNINGRSVIVTFDPHPQMILGGAKKSIVLLSTIDEKVQFFEKHGLSAMFIIPFTYEFSRLSFEEFYVTYIVKGIGVSSVIEGSNHHFGRDREGGIDQIKQLGQKYDFSTESVPMMKVGDSTVSSSTVRELLANGDIPTANSLLGYEYMFSGIVVRGHGRGKKLGYPTANIKIDDRSKLIPKIGVYAVRILVRGRWYDGMMSIGYNPTFDDVHEMTTEVNIFNFDLDIYDDTVTVRCIERTRNEMKFNDVAELVVEMGRDKIQTQKILKNYTLINH
jgi:riboflavin kinase/FMN adenylyltransferase